ncbi:FimB/Mfa2 family fimbrial subunit [Pedobacter sp.]|uniref:FimB/Mfa2 family fimbrial subunit n=1 Tax=Pedobacter sp. TaxID=1411316 RepID=UPI003BAB54D9
MKKLVYVLLLSQLVWVTGCRKDLIDYFGGAHGNKKYTVNFRLGGLNHNVGEPNVGFQPEPLQNYIGQLSIIAYSIASGEEVARQTQLSSDPNFGQIAFSLPQGNYSFVAAGSKTPFGINRFYQTAATPDIKLQESQAFMQYLFNGPSEGDKNYITSDTFLAKDTVNITANKTVDMMMQRIIGAIEVSFNDTPTFNAELRGEMTGYPFNSGIPFGGVVVRPHFYVNTAANGPLKLLILATAGTLWLDIDPPMTNAIRVVIPVQKNKTTKVSGNIYSNQLTFTFQ